MMRGLLLSLLGLGGSIAAALPVCATDAPAFVVPGRPDVPVIINGVDASWCVVEGNWGLDRPGAVAPTVLCRTPVVGERGGPNSYYPSTGQKPRVGRFEVKPSAHRVLPPPAETFHRVWSTSSDPTPATNYPQSAPLSVMGEPPQQQRTPVRNNPLPRPLPSHR